jgi:CBS domain-containing protein
MATAKDIMTPNPVTLLGSTDVQEAVKLFTSKKITSVPVIDATGEVAGQLTELCLVRILVMHQLQPAKFAKIAHCQSFLEEAFFVEPKDNVSVVLKAILKSPSRRILVRSDGKQIHGIISPKDLIRVLTAEASPETAATTSAVQSAVEKTL